MLATQTTGAFIASLTEQKREISAILDAFFAAKRRDLSSVNQLAGDACDRLREFVLSGKMIRGSLVTLGLSICRSGPGGCQLPVAHQVGAAIELFQSGLLIHDDIMDRDFMRRGKATIFEQYSRDARHRGVGDWRHLGEALGTCVGDVAFFLGYELLGRLAPSPSALGRILTLFSRELAAVGIAQMQDVAWGADSSAQPDSQDILRLYRYKTGRYSFSLPLAAGGILAGAPDPSIEALEELGECVGIIFQIRDDELGLFGDQQSTGKPVGSDIREGKKTLLFARLIEVCEAEQRTRLMGAFGNPDVTQRDLDFVRASAASSGLLDSIQRTVRTLEHKARSIIRSLEALQQEDRRVLEDLLDYTTARTA